MPSCLAALGWSKRACLCDPEGLLCSSRLVSLRRSWAQDNNNKALPHNGDKILKPSRLEVTKDGCTVDAECWNPGRGSTPALQPAALPRAMKLVPRRTVQCHHGEGMASRWTGHADQGPLRRPGPYTPMAHSCLCPGIRARAAESTAKRSQHQRSGWESWRQAEKRGERAP